MVGDFLSAVIGHITDGNDVACSSLYVDGVEAHAVANDGAALPQALNAGSCNRGVVPYDNGAGATDFIGEIRITAAQKGFYFGDIAYDGTLNGSGRFTQGRFCPVDNGD